MSDSTHNCARCGPTAVHRAMPLMDGTPVLACLTCGRIDTEATWNERATKRAHSTVAHTLTADQVESLAYGAAPECFEIMESEHEGHTRWGILTRWILRHRETSTFWSIIIETPATEEGEVEYEDETLKPCERVKVTAFVYNDIEETA